MNRFAVLLFFSLTALCTAGCFKGADTAAGKSNQSPPQTDRDDDAPAVVSPDVMALAQGNNQFAFDLYRRLAKLDGNLIFSPYSISSALAMTYAGARGDTAAEMADTLHFTLKPDRLHPAFADLSGRLMRFGNRDGGQLLVANSLWGQQGYPIRDDFLALTRDDYHAEIKEVDFTNDKDREVARQTINRWVEQKTQDMIQELLKPRVLDSDSKLVLVNAIYFHSLWALPFPAEQTKKEPFHASNRESVQAPMMHLTDEFQYYEGDGVQVLELPYRGYRQSMVVILPKAADGLAKVENDLTAGRLEGWLAKLKGYEVTTTLPKFTTTHEFGLGQELKPMGMPLAFTDGPEGQPRADFSGISGQALRFDHCLHISQVVHQARVEVTEEGTKAAAATAVVMAHPESLRLPPPRATFTADHPFLFLIRDRDMGSILFFGRLTKPEA
jgi:serpin B